MERKEQTFNVAIMMKDLFISCLLIPVLWIPVYSQEQTFNVASIRMKDLYISCLLITVLWIPAYSQGIPTTGLFFTLDGTVYNPGSTININSIRAQPDDRSDPGSTLVCNTTNVNTHCCRFSDNPNGGSQGEWLDPNNNLVIAASNLNGGTNVFARYRQTHQLRLAIVGIPTGPLGVYTCRIPDMSGGPDVTATITITDMTAVTTTPESDATTATAIPEASSPPPVMTGTPPAPSFMVAITPALTVLEGSSVSLDCTSDISGTFMWRDSSGSILMTSSDLTISGNDMFSILTISSVHTSQAGTYTCNVMVGADSQSVESDVTVQLVSPSAVNVTSPIVILGSALNLTCTITLVAILDSGVQILVVWTDPNGTTVPGGTTPTGSGISYTSLVTLTNLKDSDAGTNYTCTASLMSSEPFITDSSTVSGHTTLSLLTLNLVVSVSISDYPINSNFYTGLQLNLTCAINIQVSALTDIQLISVTAKWTKFNTMLTQSSRRTITDVQEVRPTSHHSSLIFHSLDKKRDEGNYTCTTAVIFERNNNQVTIIKNDTKTIFVPNLYFQFLLGGISDCKVWRTNEATLKDTDILKALVDLVSGQCDCDFTSSRLTNRVFLCDPSSSDMVTYQAQLHGTRHANVSQLARVLQDIANEKRSITVQFSLLTIQDYCIVSSTSSSPCGQRGTLNTQSLNIIIIVVLVITAVLIVSVLMAIILVFKIWKYKHGKSDKKIVTTLPLENIKEHNQHEYEDFEKYSKTVIETKIEAVPDDVVTTACAAYASTTFSANKKNKDADYEPIQH